VSISWSQSDQVFVHWQKSIGSQGEDAIEDMVKDADGNMYFLSSTQSAGSQTMDILLSKYSPFGQEVWTTILGESGDDRGVAIEILNNRLFVLSASNSSTGTFAGNLGREDILLFQLNLNGELTKMSRFGGNLADIPSDITKTTNGDLLISAHSQSTEGIIDTNRGQFDMWVFRIDQSGTLIWKRNYGGSDEDFSSKINELPNGEIVFSGHSSSYDGDMILNYGDFDISLFKLTSTGDIIWKQNYGGLQAEVAEDLLIHDGRIFLAGNTQSLSYDITKNAGFSDAWIIETDATNGELIWETTHGSEFGDYASALAMDASNQLYIVGTTNASVFQGEPSSGHSDAWIAKVNSPYSINHIALFGGEAHEAINGFRVENDGSILVYGSSNSTNDLFANNQGNTDGWVMKAELNENQVGNNPDPISAHPNPTNDIVYLNNLTDSDKVVVYSTSGQQIASFQANSFTEIVDLTSFSPGVYLVQVERSSGVELIRLIRD